MAHRKLLKSLASQLRCLSALQPICSKKPKETQDKVERTPQPWTRSRDVGSAPRECARSPASLLSTSVTRLEASAAHFWGVCVNSDFDLCPWHVTIRRFTRVISRLCTLTPSLQGLRVFLGAEKTA